MGSDRTSTVRIGNFVLHTDKDHLGFYRGNQAISEKFRGWHYHIESEKITQLQIFLLLERELGNLKAQFLDLDRKNLYIGSVNRNPLLYRVWKLGERTCVLWIGVFGKLHVEANKRHEFVPSILKKDKIVKILKDWNEKLERKECLFYVQEWEKYTIHDCDYCLHLQGSLCEIHSLQRKLELEMKENQKLLEVVG